MIENQTLGNKLNRAKPITLTFYDSLENYPYSTTFYVHENTLNEQCEKLIQAISNLSSCVLGKYKIGYEQFVVQNYHEKFAKLTPSTFGTEKWVIKLSNTTFGTGLHAHILFLDGIKKQAMARYGQEWENSAECPIPITSNGKPFCKFFKRFVCRKKQK